MSPNAIRRILVAIKHPTAPAPPSLMKAAQLAGAWNAEMVLFHAIDMPLYTQASDDDRDPGEDQDSIRAHFLRNLTVQAAQVRERGVEVSVAAEWDYPAHEAVLRHAQHIGADLIVTEHHPHSTSSNPWGLQTADWELLRLSEKPVLLVKDARPYQQPVVLAAVDPLHRHAKPADLDMEIGTLAMALSAALDGSCHLVYAIGGMAGLNFEQVAGATVATPVVDPERARAQAALEQLLQSLQLTAQSVQLPVAPPTEAILESTRKLHSSVLVLGAISRSGLRRLIIGNTAERVLDQVTCDLLVVKPKGFGIHFPREVRGAQMLLPAMTVPPLG